MTLSQPSLRRRTRSPQIGPGTGIGRSAPTDDRPAVFNHLAWSAGVAFPDVELWCYLVNGQPGAPAYTAIAPADGFNAYEWLDQVPEGQGFQPDPNDVQIPLSFRQYAVARMLSVHGITTTPSDWEVRVARPFPFSDPHGTQRRFGAGFYEVRQTDRSSALVSWVWVLPNFEREVWFHWLPGTANGFAIIGTSLPPLNTPYTSTTLQYRGTDGSVLAGLDVNDVEGSSAILRTRLVAPGYPGSPAASVTEITVNDYRIGGAA